MAYSQTTSTSQKNVLTNCPEGTASQLYKQQQLIATQSGISFSLWCCELFNLKWITCHSSYSIYCLKAHTFDPIREILEVLSRKVLKLIDSTLSSVIAFDIVRDMNIFSQMPSKKWKNLRNNIHIIRTTEKCLHK